jgi:hypothetical protein
MRHDHGAPGGLRCVQNLRVFEVRVSEILFGEFEKGRRDPRTIQRAKLFARIHHERRYQSWLKKIVEERIETEYEIYKRLQKEIN